MKAIPDNEIITISDRNVLISGPRDDNRLTIAGHDGDGIRVPDVTGTMDGMTISKDNVGGLVPVSMDRECLDRFHIYVHGDMESGRYVIFSRELGTLRLSVPMKWSIDWDHTFDCMTASGTMRDGKSGYMHIHPDGRVVKSDSMG